jgi:hypothetical protein
MSNWDFRAEKNQNNTGSTTTNPTGGLKAGFQPFSEADTLKSKRNVIATNKGWVRRTHKKNSGSSTTRQIDEILVAANPGTSTGYAGAGYLGFPDIAQVYMQNSSSDSVTTIVALDGAGGSEHQICVVFNEPVKFNSSVKAKVVLANTAGGNNGISAVTTSAVNSNTNIINANNTLVFRFTPTAGDAGTYKIAAATTGIANGSSGTLAIVGITSGEAANNTITGAVSNNFIFTITAG